MGLMDFKTFAEDKVSSAKVFYFTPKSPEGDLASNKS